MSWLAAARRLTVRLADCRRLVVLTGAGISTESGIPDYRGGGAYWTRYDAGDFAYERFVASEAARRNYWRMAKEFFDVMRGAEPNAAHLALVELERSGILDCVLTQNVDGLHQRAGHRAGRVLEVHGTATQIRCLDCQGVIPARPVYEHLADGDVPYCARCRGILKPDVVLFGEPIPLPVAAAAAAVVEGCDFLLVIGSSLTVQPLASLPSQAKGAGAGLGIVNLSSTPYDAEMDVIVRGAAGQVLAWVAAALREQWASA